jgi:hypothetical protein
MEAERKKERLPRALTVSQLLQKKYEVFPFEGPWYEAFGTPERTGVWFIWGNSGNGKSNFAVQLCCELAKYCKVVYNSLEEGDCLTVQQAFSGVDAKQIAGKLLIARGETISQISERLKRQRSPEVVIIDSFQHAQLSYSEYLKFKTLHSNKLIVFISHADGKLPSGRSAKSARYDAALKIWVEGFIAQSMGRFIGPNGGKYIVWEEGAFLYHGENGTI